MPTNRADAIQCLRLLAENCPCTVQSCIEFLNRHDQVKFAGQVQPLLDSRVLHLSEEGLLEVTDRGREVLAQHPAGP